MSINIHGVNPILLDVKAHQKRDYDYINVKKYDSNWSLRTVIKMIKIEKCKYVRNFCTLISSILKACYNISYESEGF